MLRSENPTRPATIDELLSSDLIAKVSQLDVSSRKIFAGKLKGERRSKKRGESVEFADVVLDCTGTYDNPNALGRGGIRAPGEAGGPSCRKRGGSAGAR